MNKFFLHRVYGILAVSGAVLSTIGTVSAQTFIPIKEPECLSNVSPLFTTGGQYVDVNNGVLDNSWSMLSRWQGDNFAQNAVNYDLSGLTRMNYADTGPWTPPAVGSVSNWQRGVQPESEYYSTPGVQLYCNMMGMLINTWWVPHVNIVGGGYNDMFGYSWSTYAAPAPDAFVIRNPTTQYVDLETDLIVQADIAVPAVYTYRNASNPAERPNPDAQVALFAYVIDTSNPTLHPIAFVSGTHDTWAQNIASSGGVGCDYATGVYFASGVAGKSTAYFTSDPASAQPQLLVDKNNAGEPYQFYRMRVTPGNFRNIINAINTHGPGCPTAGYSTDISNYQIKYAGVITETVLFDNRFDAILNDPNKDQISIAVKAKNVGIYRRF